MSASLIDRVRERLATESGPLRPNVVADAIRAESGGVLGDTEVLSNLRVLQTELTGAGILEPLLCADGTTDVLVTAPDAVWIDDGNGLRRTSIRFADEAAVRRLAQRLALSAGRRLDDAQPWVDGQLTGFGTGQFAVRLHAVLPPIAVGGTCLSLRVLRPATQDLAALIAAGTIAPSGRGTARRHHRGAAGLPHFRRYRRGQDHAAVRGAGRGRARRAHRLRRGRRRTGATASASGQARGAMRQCRRRRRGDRSRTGQAGAADAAGPDRGRRGARCRGGRSARRAQHRPRRWRRHGARQQPREVPARLEALAALGGLDRAALHSQLAAAVQVVLHVGRDRTGRRRLSEIAVLERNRWAGAGGHRVARRSRARPTRSANCTGCYRVGRRHDRAALLPRWRCRVAVVVLPSSPADGWRVAAGVARPFPPHDCRLADVCVRVAVGAVLLPLTTVFAA